MYQTVVPALRELANHGSMSKDSFLELCMRARQASFDDAQRFMRILVDKNIISCVGATVAFQSRAAQWFAKSVERLPSPPVSSPPPGAKRG